MDTQVQEKVEQFFTGYPQRIYPKGQILIFMDEPPDHAFYIKSGVVKVFDISYRGEEVIVNLYKNPAFFPMSWVLNRTKNKFYYVTEQPCELYVVPVDDAYTFLKENPDVVFDLLRRLYIGVDGLLDRMVMLMAGSARSRLACEMVIDCKRFATKITEKHYILSTNEVGFAARTGLSRETISRELNKLKRKKYISTSPRLIEVLNFPEIEKISEGDL